VLCSCEQKEILDINIEDDVAADPLWCIHCGCNLDIEAMPISNKVKRELIKWASEYGSWIDWDLDEILPRGIDMETEHNRQGEILFERLKQELGGRYNFKYTSSTMGRRYASN
jgi:hypothetical protein